MSDRMEVDPSNNPGLVDTGESDDEIDSDSEEEEETEKKRKKKVIHEEEEENDEKQEEEKLEEQILDSISISITTSTIQTTNVRITRGKNSISLFFTITTFTVICILWDCPLVCSIRR